IEVVELDPSVVKIAHGYFGYQEGTKTKVIVEDGRVFIKRTKLSGNQYDLIILDAFTDEYIPEHMMTREFIKEVKTVLAPNGVLAANTINTSRLYDNESVTYKSVFPTFFNLRMTNRVIIARNGELPTYQELEENAAQIEPLLEPFGISAHALVPLFSL